ncbi:hypothetical protein NQ318_011737 [Aromia moschata]|uniref:Mos1 transposase HTH domain-containing protein n=1 Tax=Aromia moschata TaxID=1265417 RepID=A0AAV8XMD9_9CUCU|nr:hypothetical protein NQ318_011737 [Aromia moschata]
MCVTPEDIGFDLQKFCFRLGHSAADTFAKLQHAYGNSVFSRTRFFWFKAFSEGRESIKDEPRSGSKGYPLQDCLFTQVQRKVPPTQRGLSQEFSSTQKLFGGGQGKRVIGRKRGFEGDGRLGVCQKEFMHPQESFLSYPTHQDLLTTPQRSLFSGVEEKNG